MCKTSRVVSRKAGPMLRLREKPLFSPSFRRHQLWDISPKSGRNQLSQVPGKQPKDPKQLFFLGSFKTGFWGSLLRQSGHVDESC